MEKLKLLNGNNIELLKTLESNSVDSIITDPPYGLSFMGKKWDYDVPSTDFWKEVLRVLKPGGHVLSFGGTRTYHRMVVNMEDAGFEIRDQIMWLYGSGFPKSHNVGLSIDKKQGHPDRGHRIAVASRNHPDGTLEPNGDKLEKYEAKTDEGKKWNGWGTALKPANEPICLARKPLEENTIAKNVLKYGTGGINVDGCRIGTDIISTHNAPKGTFAGGELERGSDTNSYTEHEGRFPANIILECICDEVIKGKKGEKIPNYTNGGNKEGKVFGNGKGLGEHNSNIYVNEIGDIHTNSDCPCRILDEQNNGVSRFFYTAKVSKKERNMGLEEFEETTNGDKGHGLDRRCSHCNTSMLKPEDCKCEEPNWITPPKKNIHPTVKPVQLMTYLCRLITPPNGTILDPFMGSGSTGISALLEGFNFIGMEMDESYFKIAEARINNYEKYGEFLKK